MSNKRNAVSRILQRIQAGVHRLTESPSSCESADTAEIIRLAELPRYVETTTNLLGFDVTIPDGPSFIAEWKEIFQNRIYDFSTKNPRPRILDCGANVGLSCLFFKQAFEACNITAFEPDPHIFAYLKQFVASARLSGIELVSKAVWSSATNLPFRPEGADSGRISLDEQSAKVINVPTVRLRDYLCERIDFLKIDIEGAETEVIADCADKLDCVDRLFVEYHSFTARPQTLHRILTVLKDAEFRVQIHEVFKSGNPFLRVSEHLEMDLQLNIFAYRPENNIACES